VPSGESSIRFTSITWRYILTFGGADLRAFCWRGSWRRRRPSVRPMRPSKCDARMWRRAACMSVQGSHGRGRGQVITQIQLKMP
jgi:hypothetical protein